jgi:hypothetical protein
MGRGDLPGSHRRLRGHDPPCCCYTKIAVEAGCPGRHRTCNRRVNSAPLSRLSYWTMTGTGPRNRTAVFRLSGGRSAAELDRRLAGAPGFEPGTSDFRGPRSAAELRPVDLHSPSGASPPHGGIERGPHPWYSVVVSNHRPLVCKTSALPAELTEHGRRGRTRTRTALIKSQALCPLSYAP